MVVETDTGRYFSRSHNDERRSNTFNTKPSTPFIVIALRKIIPVSVSTTYAAPTPFNIVLVGSGVKKRVPCVQ